MKQEFNIKSGAATQRYLRAMAFMVPPLLTIGITQGWQGLLLWTSFTAMAAHWHFWQNPTSFTPETVEKQRKNGDIQSSSRLTTLAARVAKRYDMPNLPVQYSKSVNNAATDNHRVFINPLLGERMNNREIEWLIAHELDHARHTTDTAFYTAYVAANVSFVAIGAFSLWPALQSATMSAHGLSAAAILGTYAAGRHSLTLAYRSVQQGSEFRCDTNALQNTGSLHYAQTALKTAASGSPFIYDMFHHKPAFLQRLHATHPSVPERLVNLDKTWKTMQRDAKTGQAPAP